MKEKQKYTRIGVIFFTICFIVLSSIQAYTQPPEGQEYRVKAGFIYHFVRFTQWPAKTFKNTSTPFILCVASTHPDNDILLSLHDKKIKNRNFIVKKYKNKQDIETCHILFIASKDENFVIQKLNEAKDHNILTIGEMGNFANLGGIINFFIEDDRLRFAVNLNAASRAKLKLSAQLLMSAEIIR